LLNRHTLAPDLVGERLGYAFVIAKLAIVRSAALTRGGLRGTLPEAALVGRGGAVRMILVTGAAGLVGRHVVERLSERGLPVRTFDIRHRPGEDVRDPQAVADALQGVTGILHLAAVSRVVHGERDPENCRATNLGGLKAVIDAALTARARPWLVFVSSREVYGDAAQVPATEDAPFCPLNVYARTKVMGEQMVGAARDTGLTANVCRLSTVYGSIDDHADRVLPAFCAAAAQGGHISVHGNDVVLDPVHIDDASEGLVRLVDRSAAGESLPPIHFVSGRGMSILELARMAVAAGDPATRITLDAPRTYDVKRFVGDPGRAGRLLGWNARISIDEGIRRFVADFRGDAARVARASAAALRAAAL
jgi:nucleoside-diphosphate-sugar epimerase